MSSGVIKNKNKTAESAGEQNDKKTFPKSRSCYDWADAQVKQKAEESLNIMSLNVNSDVEIY